jgi:hypothetical protein
MAIAELDGFTVSALQRAIAKVNQRWSVTGWLKNNYYLECLHASETTLSRWSRLHMQSSAPTNSYWARVVDYGLFSLCVIGRPVP